MKTIQCSFNYSRYHYNFFELQSCIELYYINFPYCWCMCASASLMRLFITYVAWWVQRTFMFVDLAAELGHCKQSLLPNRHPETHLSSLFKTDVRPKDKHPTLSHFTDRVWIALLRLSSFLGPTMNLKVVHNANNQREKVEKTLIITVFTSQWEMELNNRMIAECPNALFGDSIKRS